MECLLLWGLDVVIYPVTTSYIVNLSRNDIGLINMDVILSPFKKYFKNYFHLKINTYHDHK
jgi:hypothetical protein